MPWTTPLRSLALSSRAPQEWSKSQKGLEQYSILKFAEAFEVVPRTLAENSGLDATDVVSALYAAHSQGQTTAGACKWGGRASCARARKHVPVYVPFMP